MKNTVCCVFSTAPDRECAEKISKVLLDEGLAACAQIGAGMVSQYVWKGERQSQAECPVCIKTSERALEKLRARYAKLHPYECPEWLVVRAEASEEYFKWVEDSCFGA